MINKPIENYDAQNAKKQMVDALKEFAGSILFIAMMFAFALLCCACSGYHWE